jgi:hypothetical protein
LHLIRTPDVEVLADHLLEEDAATKRAIQDLGQGELGLEDGQVIAIVGRAIPGGGGMGETRQVQMMRRMSSAFRLRISGTPQ